MSWNNVIPTELISKFLDEMPECERCGKGLALTEWLRREDKICWECEDEDSRETQ